MAIDDTDRKIVGILNSNGRISNKEIGEKLGISEGTVRNRIRQLSDAGTLKIAGLIRPDDSPGKQLMLLGIKIASSKDLTAKAEEISALEGVISTHITAGRYDIIAEVWLDSRGGLINFLSQVLAEVEGVSSTESFLVMKSIGKWIVGSDI